MAIQDDNTLLCKGDLKAYHEKILPYLGGNFMLGTNVSDYYSTDEKIVGVWTDGRPLYQITYNFTMPSANVDYTIATLPVGANPKQMYGGIEWDTSSYIEVNYYDSSAPTSCLCYVSNRLVIITGRDQDLANRPAFITVKYTKSSDAANSAVTTPGCYDINFPNTWPENKEIYFGNGLYGQKFKGTVSNVGVVQTTATGAKNIINCHFHIGGPDDSTQTPVTTGYWATNNFVSGVYLDPDTQFNGLVGSVYYNKKYEMWVTYTK